MALRNTTQVTTEGTCDPKDFTKIHEECGEIIVGQVQEELKAVDDRTKKSVLKDIKAYMATEYQKFRKLMEIAYSKSAPRSDVGGIRKTLSNIFKWIGKATVIIEKFIFCVRTAITVADTGIKLVGLAGLTSLASGIGAVMPYVAIGAGIIGLGVAAYCVYREYKQTESNLALTQ